MTAESPADLRARLTPLAAAATVRPWFYNSYSRVSAAEYLDRDEEAGEQAPEDCIWPHRHRCTACVEMLHLTPEGKRYEVLTCQAPVDLYEADSTVCTVPAHHGDTATGRHAGDAAFIVELVNSWPAIDAMLARLETAEADAKHWKANHDEVVRRKQGVAAFLSIARSHARGLRASLAVAEAHMATCPLLMKEGAHQECDWGDDY